MFRFIFCLAFLLLAAASHSAAERGNASSGRLAWICVSSIPDDVTNPVFVQTSRDISEMTMSRRSSSQPVQVPADGEIAVLREIVNPADPTDIRQQIIARATMPEGVRQAIVMLIALSEPRPDGIRFHATVHDLSEFRGGGYMFLNLTRVNVEVRMGDERIRVGPGQNSISNGRNLTSAQNVPISYHFHDPRVDAWRLISASTVARIPTRREICIFSWDERFNRINHHGITFAP